jgi:putative transposase
VPRFARVVAVGAPHHVTQRGNNRQRVFHSQQDYRVYLALLAERARQHECCVLGYCLMPNHVHLVVIPDRSQALARALGRAHNAYSRYVNGRLARSGHLWQSRFYSAPLSRHHLIDALRYVALNPLRAKLVERAAEYRWSSAAAHLAGHDSSGLLDLSEWSKICPPGEWSGQLAYSNEEERWAERLREATRHGRPWGDESFVRQISELAGRDLIPGPRGRPRGNGKTAPPIAASVVAGR